MKQRRLKYFEERIGDIYFVFGTHSDGRVDVCSHTHDPVCTVSPEHAENLIRDRDLLLQIIRELANRLPDEEWEEFYGDPLFRLIEKRNRPSELKQNAKQEPQGSEEQGDPRREDGQPQ